MIFRNFLTGKNIIFGACVFACMYWVGCAGSRGTAGTRETESVNTGAVVGQSEVVAPYCLAPGDDIEVKYFYFPELDEQLTIPPDGIISLQLVQDVRATGLTVSQLEKILRQAYSERLERPELTVLLRKSVSMKAYVGGEVRTPQVISIEGPVTITQALYAAGGPLDSANMSSVIIIRKVDGDEPKLMRINLDSQEAIQRNDIALLPHDIVHVPKKFISQVGLFVRQYIDDIIPKHVSVGFAFVKRLDDNSGTSVEFLP